MNKITNKTAIKKAFAALMALIIALSLAACGSDGGKEKTESTESKLSVVCSIFPVYDFARTISGGKADVRLLLPPGMDSHDFEPSVGDMVLCDSADLFIYTDSEMEVWADGLSKGFTHAKAVRCADGIDLEALNEDWEAIENEH